MQTRQCQCQCAFLFHSCFSSRLPSPTPKTDATQAPPSSPNLPWPPCRWPLDADWPRPAGGGEDEGRWRISVITQPPSTTRMEAVSSPISSANALLSGRRTTTTATATLKKGKQGSARAAGALVVASRPSGSSRCCRHGAAHLRPARRSFVLPLQALPCMGSTPFLVTRTLTPCTCCQKRNYTKAGDPTPLLSAIHLIVSVNAPHPPSHSYSITSPVPPRPSPPPPST